MRVIAFDGDKWKYRPNDNYARGGGDGFGITFNEVMYTLTATDRHFILEPGEFLC